jgi:hypothetical protein
MKVSVLRSALIAGCAILLGACGKGDKNDFQAAADSMGQHRDSTIRALDSSKTGAAAGQQVDTTKLGAAKTESILTKARKAP